MYNVFNVMALRFFKTELHYIQYYNTTTLVRNIMQTNKITKLYLVADDNLREYKSYLINLKI